MGDWICRHDPVQRDEQAYQSTYGRSKESAAIPSRIPGYATKVQERAMEPEVLL